MGIKSLVKEWSSKF